MNVFTAGTFDLLHYGHENLLRRASELGTVTVGLNTDNFVKKYKGRLPVQGYEERKQALRQSGYVWQIRKVKGHDLRPLLEAVAPDLLVIGSDWQAKDYHTQIGTSQEWLDEKGIELVYLPYTEGVSTTQLREKMGR